MRVAYLAPIGDLGGAERCLLDLIVSLRSLVPEIQMLLVCGTDGQLAHMAEQHGVEVIVLEMPRSLLELGDSILGRGGSIAKYLRFAGKFLASLPNATSYAKELRNLLIRFQPDLIHSNGMKFHVLLRLAGFQNAPVIFHLRDFLKNRVIASHAIRWASSCSSQLIAVSKAVADEALAILESKSVSVIYDGIDVDEFHPLPGSILDLDSLAGLIESPPNTVRVGLIATYAIWKGHYVFLDAVSRVVAESLATPTRFYIVGGPIYNTTGSQVSEESLRRRISELDLKGCTGLIGFQHAIAPVYRSLDIVVHASTEPEPFGRTIVEPMACGKPVIVTATGGAAEIFTSGIDAVGVSSADPAQLSDAILRLVSSEPERTRLGQNARNTAVTCFSRQRAALDIKELYESILSRQRS